MSNLKNEYDRILSEIEKAISNEEEKKVVKEKVSELSMLFINAMENMSNVIENKLKEMEEKQNSLDNKLNKIQSTVNEIESDIYDEEEIGEYDFEIVCPYCNNEFVTDLSLMNEEKTEIKCPECNNIIELDWNDDCDCEEDDDCCSGHCGSCHGCSDEDCEEDEEENEDEDM